MAADRPTFEFRFLTLAVLSIRLVKFLSGSDFLMVDMDKIVSLCKRRGFIFQSSEIYGGTGSCWDYGPLGVELKNNVKRVWWRDSVQNRADMVGLDSSILMHPRVWKASGHLDHFTDPMVDCRACKRRFRSDKLEDDAWVHYCE